MMAGNPSFWTIMNTSSISQQQIQQQQHQIHQNLLGGVESSFSDNHQELPQSWSQLLLGGLAGEEDKFGGVMGHFQPFKKLENWEDHILMNPTTTIRACELSVGGGGDHVKQEQEVSQNRNHSTNWSQTTMPVSSPRSCVTTSFSSNNNNNILDFSNTKDGPPRRNQHPPPDHSSECNSTATGGACKKARVQPSSSQPPLKVRKEKLGDRITALHQLVSPFGKTDTASVLLEAIGYIRFLQGQIEALSSPYLGNASGNMRAQHSVIQGERNSVFVGEAGNGMQIDPQEKAKDLRSRGLCLVPVSCTQQVGSDNGADYWAPAFGSGGGF